MLHQVELVAGATRQAAGRIRGRSNILVIVSPVDVDQVRSLWRHLTGAPAAFTSAAPLIVASNNQAAGPPAWASIIELCGSAVVSCPAPIVDRMTAQLAGLSADQMTQPAIIDALLDPVETLGPALLFYGPATIAAEATTGTVVGPLEIDDPRVQSVIEDATDAERDEAALADTTSGAYIALTSEGTPAAACAWREWPLRVAHISVLTATSHRSSGHGTAAAQAAMNEAIVAGLLPQWRAAHQNQASIGLARRLGLELLGHQYSVRLT